MPGGCCSDQSSSHQAAPSGRIPLPGVTAMTAMPRTRRIVPALVLSVAVIGSASALVGAIL